MGIEIGVGAAVVGFFGGAAASTGAGLAIAGAIAGAIDMAIVGAVVGGISSAVMGGDIGQGILMGAIGGAIGGAVMGAFNPSMFGIGGGTLGTGGVSGEVSGLAGEAGQAGVDMIEGGLPEVGKELVTKTAEKTLGETLTTSALDIGMKGLEKGLPLLLAGDKEMPYSQTKEGFQEELAAKERIANLAASASGGHAPNYTREVAAMNIKARQEEMATQRKQYKEDIATKSKTLRGLKTRSRGEMFAGSEETPLGTKKKRLGEVVTPDEEVA